MSFKPYCSDRAECSTSINAGVISATTEHESRNARGTMTISTTLNISRTSGSATASEALSYVATNGSIYGGRLELSGHCELSEPPAAKF